MALTSAEIKAAAMNEQKKKLDGVYFLFDILGEPHFFNGSTTKREGG